jgi:outer membrane receptor protein involved in Fe transport
MWKARANLTLSLGLRYEYAGNPENYEAYPGYNLARGPFNNLTDKVMVKNDTNNFGPRVGVTYSPNFLPGILGEKKTVFRGGFGVFYDSFYTLMLDNTQASAPNAVADSVVGTSGRGLANASTLIAQQSPVLNPLAGQTSVASNLENPKIYQWNLDVQRELPASMIMTLAYAGTRGEHLFESDTINAFAGYDPNALASGALAYLPRLNPAAALTRSAKRLTMAPTCTTVWAPSPSFRRLRISPMDAKASAHFRRSTHAIVGLLASCTRFPDITRTAISSPML